MPAIRIKELSHDRGLCGNTFCLHVMHSGPCPKCIAQGNRMACQNGVPEAALKLEPKAATQPNAVLG